MGNDLKIVAPTEKNYLCTKLGVVDNLFWPAEAPPNSPVYKHFKPIFGDLGWGVAHCSFVKYTACRKTGKKTGCSVKKTVWCNKVCKHKGGVFGGVSCRSDLCKHKTFGPMACSHIAGSI